MCTPHTRAPFPLDHSLRQPDRCDLDLRLRIGLRELSISGANESYGCTNTNKNDYIDISFFRALKLSQISEWLRFIEVECFQIPRDIINTMLLNVPVSSLFNCQLQQVCLDTISLKKLRDRRRRNFENLPIYSPNISSIHPRPTQRLRVAVPRSAHSTVKLS